MEVTSKLAREWFGGSEPALEACVARFGWPRPEPMSLLPTLVDLGWRFGPEMQGYLRIFERYELEVCDPGDAELRAPGEKVDFASLLTLQGPAFIADLVGFFTASAVVVQQDSLSFLASLAGTKEGGTSRVFYFHPHDWGLWLTDMSLCARLFRVGLEDDRAEFSGLHWSQEDAAARSSALKIFEALSRPEQLDPFFDPARLFTRVDWLVRMLLGAGPFVLSSVAAKIPNRATWEAEKDRWADAPHLLGHGLWHAYAFGSDEDIADAVAAADAQSNPIVKDCARVVEKLQRPDGFRVGDRASHEIADVAESLRTLVKPDVLAPKRRHTSKPDIEPGDLSERAKADANVARALELLEQLRRGGATAPILHCKTPIQAAILELASLVDSSFLPMVQEVLTRSLLVSDAHRDAAWGILMVRAALARDLDGFDAALGPRGTEQLGPRRRRELYQAYASFDDPRATVRLVRGAEAWIDNMESWIAMAPPEPLLVLLERDTLETHRLISTVLSQASFGPANWEVSVQVAQAAGRWASKLAVPGLRRAVERRLGKLQDGSRALVVDALVQAEGEGCATFLWSLVKWSEEEEEAAEDPEDVFLAQMDGACFLSGLIALRPDAQEVQGAAERLLESFLLRLGPSMRPRRDVLGASVALLSGIRRGEVRALAEATAPFTRLDFERTSLTRPLADTLGRLAETLHRELNH